jgi:hypothetical protein
MFKNCTLKSFKFLNFTYKSLKIEMAERKLGFVVDMKNKNLIDLNPD